MSNSSSLTTGERLVKIETDIKYTKEQVDAMNTKLDSFILSADKKFASKLTEKIMYGLVSIIVVTVIYALIKGVTL